jgi:DGQHR domain-containing protein
MDFIVDNRLLGMPVRQNQQEFIIGVFKIGQILTFTKYTTRVIRDYDEKGFPVYNDEIQRDVENSRVEKIADFLINDPEATFPTNLVLHIPEEVILKQHKHNNFIEIFIDEKVFTEIKKENDKQSTGDIYISIIDGQHRIRGIEIAISRLKLDIDLLQKTLIKAKDQELQKKLDYYHKRLADLLNIDLVVSFFIAKQIEYQAMIFSTINRTQKRVSESLVYSLFGLTTEDSPQKTSLQVVLTLNAHEKSPFHNRIKLYGGDYDRNQTPPLSQATMVKSIINLISENARQAENDRFKKRSELSKRSLGSAKDLPFRQYYVSDKDASISDILFYFFNSVRSSFMYDKENSYWDFDPETMKPTNILHTTVGFQALLEILVEILPEIAESKRFEVQSYRKYTDQFSSLQIADVTRYPFTSKSKSIFYLDMNLILKPAISPDDSRLLKLKELLKKD